MLRTFRISLRALRRHPGFTAMAILTLGVGIAITTIMFSVVYGALLKGLPFDDPDAIVVVQQRRPLQGVDQLPVPIHDYLDYRDAQRSFSDLAAYVEGTVNVSGNARAERYSGAWITPNTFSLLGARPQLGRDFQPGEGRPGADHVAILGYAMWQNRFAGDAGVIGKTIRVNAVPHTIVGVMPERFLFPENDALWLNLQIDGGRLARGQGEPLRVWGRLRPGVTIELASADIDAIARRLQAEYARTNEGLSAGVRGWIDGELGPLRQFLYAMLAAVFCVLLMACTNVANLLLTRAAHRTREVGIRAALGATRRAMLQPFLSDALLVSAGAAIIGLLVATYGIRAFNAAIVDTQPPFYIDIRLHAPVLIFIAVIAVAASLVSSAIPAYHSTRTDIGEVLKDDARGSSSLRLGKVSRALVVFEVTLSCALLVAAGLMIKSVTKLRALDPGFQTRGLFTSRIGLAGAPLEAAAQGRFLGALEERLTRLPGVQAVALSSSLPGIFTGTTTVALEGVSYRRPEDRPAVTARSVSPGLFDAFGIRVVRGRAIAPADRADSPPVAVVSQSVVDRLFAGADPIGRRIRIGDSGRADAWHTIVGVARNTYSGNPTRPNIEQIYTPIAQGHVASVDVALRTSGAPLALTPMVRDAVAALDADLPLFSISTMEEAFARPTWKVRVFGGMFAGFGFVALLLAAVGLYAVMAFAVSRRTREVGIRMALGARPSGVVLMVVRQGFAQLGLGMAIGLVLAAGVGKFLSIVLFDVQPRDPVIFAGVAAVLMSAGLLACVVPAIRAARVDPLVAFRNQ